jgi:hypothetical protein
MEKPAALVRPARRKFSYASLIRFARGPFWLGSISKLTRSPPASESKFTAESRPVRWKKYSRPSSAAMNPNPRSETNFLMVPVGISYSLLESNVANARPFRELPRPRRTPPAIRRLIYLTTGAAGCKNLKGRAA